MPAAAPDLVLAVLAPLWFVWLAVTVTIVRRRASRCDVQPVSLLSLALFRAPPLRLVIL